MAPNRTTVENKAPQMESSENKPVSGWRKMPKSKTFGVFSSISQSLSRISLGSHATNSSLGRSRNVSGSSSGTAASKVSRVPVPSFMRKSPEVDQTTAVLDPVSTTTTIKPSKLSGPIFKKNPSHGSLDDDRAESGSRPQTSSPQPDPRYVTKAMPPQYWAGRYTGLRDKFQNELLESDNMKIIIEAHSARSSARKHNLPNSVEPIPSTNMLINPSTSAYALTRIMPTARPVNYEPAYQYRKGADNSATRPIRRIPQSATSSAILETPASKYMSDVRALSPPCRHDQFDHKPLPKEPSYAEEALSKRELPLPSSPWIMLERYDRYSLDSENNHSPVHHPLRGRVSGDRGIDQGRTGMVRQVAAADAAQLMDDEARDSRVFVQLGSFCPTTKARESLHAWQQDYARRVNNEKLLPPGGTMVDDAAAGKAEVKAGLAQVSRFFTVSRRSSGSGVGATDIAQVTSDAYQMNPAKPMKRGPEHQYVSFGAVVGGEPEVTQATSDIYPAAHNNIFERVRERAQERYRASHGAVGGGESDITEAAKSIYPDIYDKRLDRARERQRASFGAVEEGESKVAQANNIHPTTHTSIFERARERYRASFGAGEGEEAGVTEGKKNVYPEIYKKRLDRARERERQRASLANTNDVSDLRYEPRESGIPKIERRVIKRGNNDVDSAGATNNQRGRSFRISMN
ncbi:hypothetical protein B0T26DRAFT_786791 [Lasiosphaeria miniovina]|uniref:Uncharacterized protein n=1 Tax=Lasiosphaeria miniovina TaxID=1954250 RepID=A0AA40A640_9PEZI|nr:uncharacterized protein B0T26DRAFT_786791 [Lasiosphaeria miniovina]KAK0709905.1 hypothetical protein B0T26DRAFT_786791 [Lasiosphaeria miniovina]